MKGDNNALVWSDFTISELNSALIWKEENYVDQIKHAMNSQLMLIIKLETKYQICTI